MAVETMGATLQTKILIALVAVFASISETSLAQEAAPTAPLTAETTVTSPNASSEGPVCEVHVWPTQSFLSLISGAGAGFAVIGALVEQGAYKTDREVADELLKSSLDPATQASELAKLDLSNLLKLQNPKIILETGTLAKGQDKTNARLSSSTNTCYAEIIVQRVTYQKAMMYGSSLLPAFVYRDFSENRAKPKITDAYVRTHLSSPLPKTTPEDPSSAQADIRSTFGKGFGDFVTAKVRP